MSHLAIYSIRNNADLWEVFKNVFAYDLHRLDDMSSCQLCGRQSVSAASLTTHPVHGRLSMSTDDTLASRPIIGRYFVKV